MYARVSRQSVHYRSTAVVQKFRRDMRDLIAGGFSPHVVATSFAIGVFITTLPTMGLGLVLFLVLVARFDQVNEVALFGSMILINPLTKILIYYASFRIGDILFAPTDIVIVVDPGIVFVVTDLVKRMVIGNVIIAFILAAASYGMVRVLATRYQQRHFAHITV